MEDTLRGKDADVKNFDKGLNPCFNGRYSQRRLKQPYLEQGGLNPCFNGRYSQRTRLSHLQLQILSLNPCFNGRYSQRAKTYVPLYTSIWSMFKLLETLLLT